MASGFPGANAARAMEPTISVEELVSRARERCQHHRQGVGGGCRGCLLAEIEEAVAVASPRLGPGEVFELVEGWLVPTVW